MNAMVDLPVIDRTKFIGGSDVAAIMCVSPWKTPVALWLEKTGQAAPEVISKDRERVFARGKRLEPIVVDMVIDKLREQGHTVELIQRNARYFDPEHAFMTAEIDFELMLDGEHINGDAKTVHGFARNKWGDEETDEIPVEYSAQFMHGMMLTGRRRCLVAALIGLDDVAIYWLERDDETIAAIRAREVDFWINCVLARQAPDPLVYDDVTAIYGVDDGTRIEATDEVRNALRQIAEIRSRIKQLEEHKDSLTLEVVDFIRPHAIVTYGGEKIATWKSQSTRRIDTKKLTADLPEVARQYTNTTISRVLRISKEE